MPIGAVARHLFLCAVCPCAILKKSAVCLRVEVRTLTRLAAFGGRRNLRMLFRSAPDHHSPLTALVHGTDFAWKSVKGASSWIRAFPTLKR